MGVLATLIEADPSMEDGGAASRGQLGHAIDQRIYAARIQACRIAHLADFGRRAGLAICAWPLRCGEPSPYELGGNGR